MRIVEYNVNTHLYSNYCIAHVSDLHSNPGKKALESIVASSPDMICITGDFVNTSLNDWPKSVGFLKSCVKTAKTYLSLGNHDYLISKSEIEQMKDMGVTVLNDESEQFNQEITVGGLTSAFYHKCELYDPKADMKIVSNIEWLQEFNKMDGFKILLDHHPENYELYTKEMDIDLILSGHNHGGQIRLFGHGVYARNQGFFPKYDGGVFDNKLVISRGLSNTMPLPRIFNPTELVYIHLTVKK